MNSIIILGPTATGKTKLAAHLAYEIKGEIISADSRQVYRGMDIGTGKDLQEFQINDHSIPYHLIDIRNAGEKYNLSNYQKDFQVVYDQILERKNFPIIVGGTGLYIEAILNNYSFSHIPNNLTLRNALEGKPGEELLEILTRKNTKNIEFDTSTIKRTIRAIEICEYLLINEVPEEAKKDVEAILFGIKLPRHEILKRIKKRLKDRLENGMVEEVQKLLDGGISTEDLIYYGLEYKFVTLFLLGQLKYDEMYEKLNIAIRQFAKRQMTWFRRMERNGFKIHWIDGMKPVDEQLEYISKLLDQHSDWEN